MLVTEIETFQIMDVVFYAIAVYAGYRFSINKIPREDYVELSKE